MRKTRTLLFVALGLIALAAVYAAAIVAPKDLAEDGTPRPTR